MSASARVGGESARRPYGFADFTLDVEGGFLRRAGEEVPLRRKTFQLLVYLVQNHGRVIAKEELIEAIWPETAVTDNSLMQCIGELRRILGDDAQQMIRTVARRGYVFAAGVTSPPAALAVPASAARVGLPVPRWSRRLAAAGVALLAILTLFVIVARKPDAVRTMNHGAVTIHSIAVLPLENLSRDTQQAYFADGITEALISHLAQIRALHVISRTSVMRYKGAKGTLPEIARELSVDAVLEGTVQRSHEHVRVTVNLIRAADDTHVWTGTYDSDASDVLTLENQIASAVAAQVHVQVTAAERDRLASSQNIKPEAHDAYLLGRYHLRKNNQEDAKTAITSFERALALEPNYAGAYAGLSDAWRQAEWMLGSPDAPARARAATARALALDDQMAEAHAALGRIKMTYERDWSGAEHEFLRALQLDPGDVDAHKLYGHLLSFVARHDEAVLQGGTVIQLDPLSADAYSTLGRILFRARRYQESARALERAVELEPRNGEAFFRLGDTYTELQRYDEAVAAYDKTAQLTPQFEGWRAGIARVDALRGKKERARKVLTRVRTRAALAGVYAALGNHDQAFRLLQAEAEDSGGLGLVNDPVYDRLHSDPRWPELLRRLNLPSH